MGNLRGDSISLPSLQATMSINLSQQLFADPEFGEIYRSLFSGGSWFAADQAFWEIQQKKAFSALGELVETKPSPYNVSRAEALLAQLQEASSQIVPPESSMVAFTQTEAIVKTWSAPAMAKRPKTDNAFSVLDDDE
jgi:hypothetical protein